MPENQNPLLFISIPPLRSQFTSPVSGRDRSRIPIRDRIAHSQRLLNQLSDVLREAINNNESRTLATLPSRDGMYIIFNSLPGFDLIFKSLDSIRRNGIKLLNIREIEVDDGIVQSATVFIPRGQESYFVNKLIEYAEKDDPRYGNPKNDKLIRSIEEIKLAIVESFWQSKRELLPNIIQPVWCEAWLRVDNDENRDEILVSFSQTCQMIEVPIKINQGLKFPERHVVMIFANEHQLKELIASSDFIAEFRRAQETARFWMNLQPSEQAEWVDELQNRMQIPPTNISICILDTGVNNGHPLLQQVLSDVDCHTFIQDWGTNDHDKHGTLVAGLAAFGDLEKHLSHNLPIVIQHKLESVKILPPRGINDPNLYGDITMQAVSLAEIQAPEQKRIIVMAVGSCMDVGSGKPSSWSGAVDQIAFGTDIPDSSIKRLLIIAAGNIDEGELNNYPAASQTTSIESPGQSWNALTIGSYTEKIQLTESSLVGYTPIAQFGGLSPFSTTSLMWEKKWPVKPDVVFEGGNAAIDSFNFSSECDDLSLLSTNYQPQQQSFLTFNKTSASAAQAAWFAAQIFSKYPDAWPETIRGLIVHSAEWTDTMLEQFLTGIGRSDYRNLIRSCGYGVPNLERATTCLNNSLTLIAQEHIQPFTRHEGNYKTNEMHLFQLPWPTSELRELGEMNVVVRITLSYFIDPSPREIGWKDRYRYASYGLRFDINNPLEDRDSFIRRINAAVREEDIAEDASPSSTNNSARWKLGPQNRNSGSIHSDSWEKTAMELASCNLVAIYPTIGWWRERHHLNKWNSWTRYSLIISLKTEDESVQIYETVANLIDTNRVIISTQ